MSLVPSAHPHEHSRWKQACCLLLWPGRPYSSVFFHQDMISRIFIQFNQSVNLTIVWNKVASLRHQLKTKTADAYTVRVWCKQRTSTFILISKNFLCFFSLPLWAQPRNKIHYIFQTTISTIIPILVCESYAPPSVALAPTTPLIFHPCVKAKCREAEKALEQKVCATSMLNRVFSSTVLQSRTCKQYQH